MSNTGTGTPRERFFGFIIADIDGDMDEADAIAEEMIQLGEINQAFNQLRLRLRECQTMEDIDRVRNQFSSSD